MIVFVYGSDMDKVRAMSKSRIDGLRQKRPDAGFFVMDDETFNEAQFDELIFSQGLFDKKFIVHLDRVLENNKEAREYILEHLDALAASENGFVITEYSLAKPTFLKIKKLAVKTEVFEKAKAEKKTEFNIFALADAIGAKDKKRMWVLLMQAYRAGLAPEQIHGVVVGQIRNIALIKRADKEKVDAGSLGLHPFIVTKAKGFAKNFTDKELEDHSRTLVYMYHGARGGEEELGVALERFVLSF